MPATLYPPASTTQWFGDTYGGAVIEPDKVVWHTTETGGWPGYGGGAYAPHLTYHADIHEWRQHFPADRSARALRNESGGVETNTDDALQVEVIAYSDEDLARSRGHLPVSELDAEALQDLADFAHWASDEWGVPLELADDWRPIAAGSLRFSFSEWRAFSGHLGHIHVPENTHWDPGRLAVHTIISLARNGGTMSWSEDLSRGTPGTDITPLADDTLAKSAGRQAAELLGYAAASFYYVRRKLGSWEWLRDRLGRAVWFNRNDATGDTHSLIVRQTRDDTRQIRTRLAALTSLVEQLVERDPDNPLSAEQVRALFQEAVEDNLVRVEVSVADAPDNGEGGADDPDSSDD